MKATEDLEEFIASWRGAHDIYTQKPQSMAAVSLCFKALSRYSLADVNRALSAYVSNPDNNFAPKPANIIKFFEGDSEFKANKAWDTAWKSIATIGSWSSVAFDDLITMKVIDDLGGWIKFCEAKESEEPFLRREFTVRFKGYMVKRPDPSMIPSFFAGMAALKDSTGANHKVLMIGDKNGANRHFNHRGVRVLSNSDFNKLPNVNLKLSVLR